MAESDKTAADGGITRDLPDNPYESLAQSLDAFGHALQGRLTYGLSPAAMGLAYMDWLLHFLNSPGKAGEMSRNAAVKGMEFTQYALRASLESETEPYIAPLPQDRRFQSGEWDRWPFNLMYQGFLLTEQWWHYAARTRGMEQHCQDLVSFMTRQVLDTMAPSNYPLTNPEVLRRTAEEGGRNLVRGAINFAEDVNRQLTRELPPAAQDYRIGEDVATTPGKVVYRNNLMELIQYSPRTETVRPEPVLITPAWIMKYYILDLSPENSLVGYLVDQGYTVFMISWKNPDYEQREVGLDDYRRLGVMAALDAVNAIVGKRKVHAVGYCLGGTILAAAAAAMARDGDDRLADLTLFAAQTDFQEAGEIMLFVDSSQIAYLEDYMWYKGYLDAKQMSLAFQLLRSNDLIWSRAVRQYLLGEEESMIDLLAWNLDATRMPYRMHSEYLRRLFHENALANNDYVVDGRPVSLRDIQLPVFAVGTERDHVAPWRSVYKIHTLTSGDVTFVLTSGGHNAGIVSEPGHPRRRFRMLERRADATHLDPDTWQQEAGHRDGSWWPAFKEWLDERSGEPVKPPRLGRASGPYKPVADAPGTYVLED